MAVSLKTSEEIESIARTGRELSNILGEVVAFLRPGATTQAADALARQLLDRAGAFSLLAGWADREESGRKSTPFPGVTSFSVNDVATHGLPDDRVLASGDLVTVDCAISIDGWCADAAVSVVVADDESSSSREVSGALRARLLAASREVVRAAIGGIAPGEMWSNALKLALRAAEKSRVFLVDGPFGHGIGRRLHEPPTLEAANGAAVGDFPFREGMVLTVEPIVSLQPSRLCETQGENGFVTTCRSDVCYEEFTVAVVPGGVRVLSPVSMFGR